MKKRMSSLALALCMVLTLLPMTALAEKQAVAVGTSAVCPHNTHDDGCVAVAQSDEKSKLQRTTPPAWDGTVHALSEELAEADLPYITATVPTSAPTLAPDNTQAPTEYGDFTVATDNGGTVDWDAINGVLKLTTAGNYQISMKRGVTKTHHIIEVTAPAEDVVNVTLTDVNISAPKGADEADSRNGQPGKTALTATSKTALTFLETNTLTGGNGGKGRGSPGGHGGGGIRGGTVADGAVIATGGKGGNNDGSSGGTGGNGISDSTIAGGAVTAIGGNGGDVRSGGGGRGGDGISGSTIADRTVIAIGGNGGNSHSFTGGNGGNGVSDSTIADCTVPATGGKGGNGFTGGNGGNGISGSTIADCTVTATGGNGGDGLTGGNGGNGISGSTIADSTVTATGGKGGSGVRQNGANGADIFGIGISAVLKISGGSFSWQDNNTTAALTQANTEYTLSGKTEKERIVVNVGTGNAIDITLDGVNMNSGSCASEIKSGKYTISDIDQTQTVTVEGVEEIPSTHTHSWAESWTADSASHWHDCDCGEKSDIAAHVYDSDTDANCNICGYTRTILRAGENGSFTIGSDKPLIITSSTNFADFICMNIVFNGVSTILTEGTDYTVNGDNTIVMLKNSCLSALGEGTYIIHIVSTTGTASASFTVKPSGEGPSTGGGSGHNHCTITASAGDGGTITPSGRLSLREGSDKAFTITPKDGYVVFDVTVDGASVKKQLVNYTYTFKNVQKSHAIKVTFIEENKVNPNTGAANPFNDVKASDWFYGAVMFVYGRGLMVGTSDTTFSPDGDMTREMFATVLGRLFGIDSTKYEYTKFADVSPDTDYAPYVAWAAKMGITSGTSATSFSPNKVITRQELAALTVNYAKVMECPLPETREAVAFADSASIASWAKDAVKAMQMAGVMNGKNDNKFDPTGTVTRAEAAATLRHYVELVIDPATAQGQT